MSTTGYTELFINRGTTYNNIIYLVDELTNYTSNISDFIFEGKIKRSYISPNVMAQFACTADSQNGAVLISLTSEQTADLWPGRYVFDVIGTSPDQIIRIVEGIITVIPSVTNAGRASGTEWG